LSSLPHLDGVELMPYHDIGLAKYEALGITYRLEHTKSPASSQIEQAEDILASHHLPLLEHISRRSI
jgi:pyruvate formate lyase activating enzyme